ncbi:transposase, partial [Escherichia coli]|nr:transposase [Escherichia coli]
SHWSTSKTPSYTKSVSWQHHQCPLGLSRGSLYFAE